MNIKIKRVFSLVLMFALLAANLAAFPVLADDGDIPGDDNGSTDEKVLTNVVITKVETPDGLKDMDLEDLAGGVNLEEWFSEAEPLPGVSFTYFEVSAEQLAVMEAKSEDYDDADKVLAYLGQDAKSFVTDETDVNGQVVLEDLAEGSYWVVENRKGTIASFTAVPFGLTLPFTNLEGNGFLETIYVYPKNTLEDTPGIDKTVDESNVLIGALNTWTVSLDIPKGIEDYEKYGFFDEIDERLDFEGVEKVVVSAKGVTLVVGEDYTVAYDDTVKVGTVGSLKGKPLSGKLTVMFTEAGRTKLKGAAEDATVDVSFQTRVNNKAIMGIEIYNTASLEYDNGHGKENDPGEPTTPEEEKEVHTGGKAFIKKDSSKDAVLEGAEFVIVNEAGKFVKVSDDKKIVEFVDKEEDATTFTSDDKGAFEIKGLPYGKYILIETRAPKGYALPTDPTTDFVVDKNSYYTNPEEVVLGSQESDNAEIVPNKLMTIPQTGGMGTLLFTLIGGLLIIAALIFNKKTEEV